MNVKVDRKTWYRGKGGAQSRLLSEAGRCCLGFAASQCGIADTLLMNVDTPGRLVRRNADAGKLLPAGFVRTCGGFLEEACNSAWIGDAMGINDDLEMGDALRENKLIALFAENGHTISFEG